MEKYKISTNQTSAKIGEETVLLDHANGEYFGLNEIGTIIWESLKNSPKDFNELKEVILSEYEVDENSVSDDLKEVLDDLLKNGLLEKTL